MSEKGIISYYNLFIILILSLSLSISYLVSISRYRNDQYYYGLLTVVQDYEDTIFNSLHEIAQYDKIPSSYYDINNDRIEIKVIDENNSIYEISKIAKYGVNTSIEEIYLIVKFKDKKFEIIEWEYGSDE